MLQGDFFSWKFQFNQYESYTFGSKMAGNPQGLFLQRAHIILKKPLIAWERSFCGFENVETSEKNQCSGIFILKLMSGNDISNYFECFHANSFLHQ